MCCMMSTIADKPSFTNEQLTSATDAAKKFSEVRKKAKSVPQAITNNGTIDSVLLDYEYYEELYLRLKELEEIEEARILSERMERLENDPDTAISWRDIKQS